MTRLNTITTLSIALWVGLVGGLIEAAAVKVAHEGLGLITNRSPYVGWMTPTVYVAIMLVVAGVTLPISVAVKRQWQPRLVLLTLTFVASTSILLSILHERIYTWALLLLAVGLAVQAQRMAMERLPAFVRFAQRSIPWLVGAVLVIAAGTHLGITRDDDGGTASAVEGGGDRPNVLLLIFDTVRRANVSLYGYERSTTPELEALAARGVVFDRAFSPSPWTLPAHASMFTGREPHELSADWNTPLDDEFPTLAEILSAAGYRTGGFVANRDYTTYQHGLDRGFARYDDYQISVAEVVLSSGLTHWFAEWDAWRPLIGTDDRLGLKRAETVADEFLGWLDDTDARPFFAFLNFFDAHDPYLPPDEWYRKFGVTRSHRLSALRRIPSGHVPTAAEVTDEMTAYDGAIAYIDHHVGRVVRELEARGVADNTLIVVTADHGEEFGEHRLLYHGHSLYTTQLWVPLVVVFPGRVPASVWTETPVSLSDLPATILDLVGEGAASIGGSSLVPYWTDADAAGRARQVTASVRKLPRAGAALPAGRGDMSSTLDWPLHTIRHADGSIEMYNLAEDPWELNDVRRRWFSRSTGQH